MRSARTTSARTLLALVALVAAAPASAAFQSDILADPTRPDGDRERDAGSKPLEVYAFFGIEPGMTVLDLMPGRGYNTHILSRLVGQEGMVYAGPDRRGAVAERVASAGLDNVTVIGGVEEIPAGSLDVIITVRNIHDLELRMDTAPIYASYLAALEPGGIFGVVDARTDAEGVDDSTHRINQDYVIEKVTAAGFELVDTSELLASEDDDMGSSEERPNRYEIDRMVLKFRKPAM